MEIKKPTLVVDLKRVEQNIKRMTEKFKHNNIQFRPHFKTHQSHFIGEMYRMQGVDKCTVSSVGMAEYFAQVGWADITIAFPANVLEADEMNALAKKVNLSILVDSVEKVKLLADDISTEISLFIEIDTGYFRSGIIFDNTIEIEKIIQTIKAVPQFSFSGFLSHTGNTYSQSSKDDVIALVEDSRIKLVNLKQQFLSEFPSLILSMGDTPAASLAVEFAGIDEMRPGNFIFYDVMQHIIGVCSIDDIAVAVYCPVVAKYPERNQIVVYGGGVHLSKEKLHWQGKDIYGLVSIPDELGFGRFLNETFVESLSQEHGIIRLPEHEFEQIHIGDILAVFPIHSCMTVDLNKEMVSLEGKQISKYRTY